ncbi:polysaccharide deacetylase family protein [Thermotoga sp.]|nr:polysaccharide deacetylase family protein [Thermotoga sp.]
MKLIALTFDDGPDTKLTSEVLDVLEEHGIVTTFFADRSLKG